MDLFFKKWRIKDSFKAKGLLEAKEKLDSMKLSGPELQEYKGYLKNLRYQNSMADSNFRDGKIEGEKAKAIEVAKNLKTMSIATEIIKKATGLNAKEIEKA